MSIKQVDIKLLWGRAGSTCSICRCPLAVDKEHASETVHIGEQAHIVGEKETAPRGVSTLTLDERNSYYNLILLCPTCHTKVDKDEMSHPVEKLHMLKSKHEDWVKTRLTEESGLTATPLFITKPAEDVCSFVLHSADIEMKVANSNGDGVPHVSFKFKATVYAEPRIKPTIYIPKANRSAGLVLTIDDAPQVIVPFNEVLMGPIKRPNYAAGMVRSGWGDVADSYTIKSTGTEVLITGPGAISCWGVLSYDGEPLNLPDEVGFALQFGMAQYEQQTILLDVLHRCTDEHHDEKHQHWHFKWNRQAV